MRSLHAFIRVDFDVIVDHLALTHIFKSETKPARTRIKRLLEFMQISHSVGLIVAS